MSKSNLKVSRGPLLATKDSEFHCEICGSRCTEDPRNGKEYGHKIGCPDRPDEFLNGFTAGGSVYNG